MSSFDNPQIAGMLREVHVVTNRHSLGRMSVMGEDYFTIMPIWKGVDRPCVGGITVPTTMAKVKDRIVKAMQVGAFWSAAEIKTDVNGKTYVCATSRVYMKRANADLKKIGY